MHFKGSDSHKTWLGALCTLIVYALVVQSIIALSTAFTNDSRQEERTSILNFDRFSSDAYNLKEQNFAFYIFAYLDTAIEDEETGFATHTFEALRPEIGNYFLYQKQPCNSDNKACLANPEGFEERKLPARPCSNAITANLTDFYVQRNKG